VKQATSKSGILDVAHRLSIVGANPLHHLVLLVANVVSFQATLSRELDEAAELDFEVLHGRKIAEHITRTARRADDGTVLQALTMARC